MANTVSITMTADDRDVLSSYQKQQSEILKNQRALMKLGDASRRAGKQGKRSGDQGARSAVAWGAKVASVAQGYLSVTGAIKSAMQAQLEFQRQSREVTKDFDTLFREFQIQTGLGDKGAKDARFRILESAQDLPVGEKPVRFAATAAKQLASSGFAPEEASGPALREFLKLTAASTAAREDPQSIAQSISQFLAATGQEKTGENLREVGRSVQRLFKTTDVQLADLSALAKEAASFSQQTNVKEQLSTFSVLRETMQAPEAATAMRSIVGRLSTAVATPKRVNVLENMGLAPEDVDFVGERLDTVLERLNRGLESLPEERRAAALKQLFEERGVAPAQTLLQRRKLIEERMGSLGDFSAFERDVEIFRGSDAAIEKSQEVRQNRFRFQQGDFGALLKGELATQAEKEDSPFTVGISKTIFDLSTAVGFSPKTAGEIAFGGPGRGPMFDAARLNIAERREGAESAIQDDPLFNPPSDQEAPRQTRLLQSIDDNLQRMNRTPPRVPRQVPSSGLGEPAF